MSNINWGNFLNNFSNNFNRVNQNNAQNTQNTQNAQNIANQQPSQTMPQQTTNLQSLLPNTMGQLNQTMAQLATLNQQQTVNMLKDLMNFPKNFEQLLTQLTTNSKMVNQEAFLLLLTSTIDMSKLSAMLQNNSKEAMSNLYQMLAQYNQLGLSLKEEQLNQLSKMIAFVAASSTSDVQTLKTTMLMYLPWLPLTNPEAFELNMYSEDEAGGINDDSISIFIQTENYGNVQADVYKTDKDGIKINLISSETFPQRDFEILMQEESKKHSININLDLAKKEAFNKDKCEKTQTQVCLNTSPKVNPFLLLISNTVIKNVHIIDDKENLRNQRKEKIENGES